MVRARLVRAGGRCPVKYTVYFRTMAGTSVQVEAENEDEARDKAYDASMPTICAQCSGWGRPGVYLELGDDWEVTEVMEDNE
jgi:hypothetical protein